MSTNGDEENEGPSVESENPEERIAARRARISRRIEAAKRLNYLEAQHTKKSNNLPCYQPQINHET